MASSVATGTMKYEKGKILGEMQMHNLKNLMQGELKKSIRTLIRDANDQVKRKKDSEYDEGSVHDESAEKIPKLDDLTTEGVDMAA